MCILSKCFKWLIWWQGRKSWAKTQSSFLPMFNGGEHVQWRKTIWQFLKKKLKIELPLNLGISLLTIYPKEQKSGTWADSCILMFIARKVKATQVYTDGWTDKQNVVYTYSEILFSLMKKEGNSDTCYKTDVSWGHCAKWNKPVTI